MEVNPIADLFPMLAEDELAELADDIKQRGLLQPIVLDADGRVLDGRNRLAACKRAGVEPEFATYEGDDPDGYALSVNIQRRNLTKGQQAMIAVKGAAISEKSQRSISADHGVSQSRLAYAATVLRHAPDIADAVVSGAMSLNEAYGIARDNKTKADSVESQLARLRAEDPDLADRVVEGDLTLPGAWAERKARAAEEDRQRKVATQLLGEVVVAVAQTNGSSTFGKYTPEYAAPGRAVTRDVIARAKSAIEEMAAVWAERNLP